MAITAVTKVREFQIDTITNAGSESYYIYFSSYSNHAQMAIDCLGAVDPTTATTTPSVKGQSLNSTYFPDAIVTGLNPFPRDGQNLAWQLNVSYGEFEKDGETNTSNSRVFDKYPWERPKQYSWSHYFDQAIMTFDKDGKPMLNSTGDKFETDVIIDRTIRTAQITFATPLASFDPKVTGDFINTVNDSDIEIAGSVFPKKTIRCLSYDSNVQTATITKGGSTKDVLFNQSTVSLAYDPLTWEGIILDVGNNERDRGRITDFDFIPYSTPQRLNGNGLRLIQSGGGGANDILTNVDQEQLQLSEDRSIAGIMAFLSYKKYEETDLNRIGF